MASQHGWGYLAKGSGELFHNPLSADGVELTRTVAEIAGVGSPRSHGKRVDLAITGRR